MTDNPTPPDDLEELLAALDAATDPPSKPTIDEDDEAPLERANLSGLTRHRELEKPAQPRGIFAQPALTEDTLTTASVEETASNEQAMVTASDEEAKPEAANETVVESKVEEPTPESANAAVMPEETASQSETPLSPVTLETSEATQELEEAEEPEEPPIVYHYRISAVLPSPLETQLNAMRESASLAPAEVGTFVLQTDFQCEDAEQLKTLVKTWADKNLPLKLTTERVEAVIVGEQRYVASWGLEPAEKFQKAQKSLIDALASYITPIASNPLPIEARLVVADHTPAEQFPRLIHTMQSRFQDHEWNINAVEILRVEEGDERWEVFEKFSRE